ncbi:MULTISPECIES: tRNA (adenosine(37)-N6)-threonylcarbamoyltransferase complex transferase subunit TsaD [unclassified Sporolactobacillus]|uniref:tRNA (adenosine(37)-N6)-threonylcarbamoyltransferase complex transferase subunit TsaD n=1 Tax=unclassified Sporolactobacillus TaxID=2628533 RepID=UPI0023674FEC|nr:tRNA (adenosine(37)-N6)-threonylcarbamoyltransferase complex transferase subunit TsaD [Sporolactobacillus sp. CQH2019]MDD9150616.1 tRNA (adenosine(37)-N6)-threonylcarbamoyltransferase complex transferase subunit TsaD [Sporolactobacillus sp. CQH2019]
MNRKTIILGIETSCDETAAAVVENGTRILANAVASQIDIHRRFGGVVPEVASRHHVDQITIVCEAAMEESGISWNDLDAIAVTQGPGLIGALLVGVNAAKALAFAHRIPLVPVHHITGHIYANRFVHELQFPLIALVVSGGHTELVLMPEHGSYRVIGTTRDDAAGEAFDKVARTLGLPYPGGPEIDRLAGQGSASIDFPRAWLEQGSLDFSFSGLKSAVINYIHNEKQRGREISKADVAASFQASVAEVLVKKTMMAAGRYEVRQLLVAGGVSANSQVRKEMAGAAETRGIPLVIPPLGLCTDNAAMIAAAGTIGFLKGMRADLSLNGSPNLAIEDF